MFADYEYYKGTYKGTEISSADQYEYYGNEASRYILRYTNIVDDDTMACECALIEYLQKSKKQGKITSETIPNYYSASYSANDEATKMTEINAILKLYLGNKYSAVGVVNVIN